MRNYEISPKGPIVVKAGGSSSANADCVSRVLNIVNSNVERQYLVSSAPGKADPNDQKVTELLIIRDFPRVREKFLNIGQAYNLNGHVNTLMDEVEGKAKEGADDEYIKSRGEWVMAHVYAKLLNAEFVDAQDIIRINKDRSINPLTYELINERFRNQKSRVVWFGFYGEAEDGSVLCFDRGGSDISGAALAKGVGASVYENLTDVDGVKAADPRIDGLKDARTIRKITYKEMRELGYRGAEVLQMDAVLPVLESGILINLRNTFNLQDEGTYIVAQREIVEGESVVAIAGKKGFVSFQIEKIGMNKETGIASKVLDVFARRDIAFDVVPSGIDNMSVILHNDQLKDKRGKVLSDLDDSIKPDNVQVVDNLGLVCLVGQGIPGNSARVHRQMSEMFDRLGISLSGESYAVNGNNIILAISDKHMEYVIKQLYKTFIKDEYVGRR